MALIEALIDFGEDENIEDDVYDNGKKHTDKAGWTRNSGCTEKSP
jgi:hypothetical protein